MENMTVLNILFCITIVLSAPLPQNLELDPKDEVVKAGDRKLELDLTDEIEAVDRKLELDVTDEAEAVDRKLESNVTDKVEAVGRKLESDLKYEEAEAEDRKLLDLEDEKAENLDRKLKVDSEDNSKANAVISSETLREGKYSNYKDDENTEAALRALVNEDDLKRVADTDIGGSNRAQTTEDDLGGMDDASTKATNRAFIKEDDLGGMDDASTKATNRAFIKENDPDKANESVTRALESGLPGAEPATSNDGSLSFGYGTSFRYGGSIGNYVPPAIPTFNYGDFFKQGRGTGKPSVSVLPVTAVSDMLEEMFATVSDILGGMFGRFNFKLKN